MLLLKSSSKRRVYSDICLPQETKNLKQPNLTPKELEKKQQTKHKISRKKEIIKMRTEINNIQTRKPIETINETKSWFFEKIKLINLWIDPSGKRKEGVQINKIRKKKEIITNITEIQRTIRDYCKQPYPNKMGNLEEMDKFLERYNLLKLNQEETQNMNRPITSTEIESVI